MTDFRVGDAVTWATPAGREYMMQHNCPETFVVTGILGGDCLLWGGATGKGVYSNSPTLMIDGKYCPGALVQHVALVNECPW